MAIVSLARAGWRSLLRWLGGEARQALELEAQLRPSGEQPLTEEDARALGAASRCTGCGLCDLHFAAYDAIARPGLRGPSDFVRGQSRALGDAEAWLPAARQLARTDLVALSRCCPVQVPFDALVACTERRAAAQREARAGAGLPAGTKRHDPG